MTKSRRDFLKTLGAGSALWLSGCASLDRLVIGDVDDTPQKVLVVGAGLAGLTAAYELKKRQIPFRLLEASPRIGGRIWTLRNMNISSQNADIGGENIESSHLAIQALAKELKLPINELFPQADFVWFGKNQEFSAKEWPREAQKLENIFKKMHADAYGSSIQFLQEKNAKQFPKAISMDAMSVAELISANKDFSSWMRQFLMSLTESAWGASPDKVSGLHLVHFMRESFMANNNQKKKIFRLDGGSGNLTQALYDRVAGVIPGRYVKLGHVLKNIEKTEKGWDLDFETANGSREFSAEAVIFTLPTSMYGSIRGWDQVPTAPGLGSLSKVLLSFKDRFWREHFALGGGGSLISDLPFAELSHVGAIPSLGLGAVHGLLQAQIGGQAAEKVTPESVKNILEAISKFDQKALVNFENISHVQNWKTYPWSKGARSYFAPGQYQKWKDQSSFAGSETWAFAGEAHSLRFMGSMNGAVESAQMAVERLSKVLA